MSQNKTDFEVVGISRSGRIRKKSSKLMDFELPEVEKPSVNRNLMRHVARSSTFYDSESGIEPLPLDSVYNKDITGSKNASTNQDTNQRSASCSGFKLWANEMRVNRNLSQDNQDNALIEMWANISPKERSAWKRKAKAIASKSISKQQETENIPTITESSAINSSFSSRNQVNEVGSVASAAAHLKLLGESLTIIGERLKDHDGTIAINGSLSVLLDSLLCSLGPLISVTMEIQLSRSSSELRKNIRATLDNIAYVMPGL